MNIAVQGLEDDIRHGGQFNSYCDDAHQAPSRFEWSADWYPGITTFLSR